MPRRRLRSRYSRLAHVNKTTLAGPLRRITKVVLSSSSEAEKSKILLVVEGSVSLCRSGFVSTETENFTLAAGLLEERSSIWISGLLGAEVVSMSPCSRLTLVNLRLDKL